MIDEISTVAEVRAVKSIAQVHYPKPAFTLALGPTIVINLARLPAARAPLSQHARAPKTLHPYQAAVFDHDHKPAVTRRWP